VCLSSDYQLVNLRGDLSAAGQAATVGLGHVHPCGNNSAACYNLARRGVLHRGQGNAIATCKVHATVLNRCNSLILGGRGSRIGVKGGVKPRQARNRETAESTGRK
jgi:hypothetical protein